MPGYWKAYKLLRRDNNALLRTPARVGGAGVSPVVVRLIVDTGATYTVLPVQVVERVGGDTRQPLRYERITGLTRNIRAPVVEVP